MDSQQPLPMQSNDEEHCRIRVAAWPVTQVLISGATTSSSSTPSHSLLIKAKIKVKLCLASPSPSPSPSQASSSSTSSTSDNSNDGDDTNNLLLGGISKFRAGKYSGRYTFRWDDLTSDDGGPTSRSWALISGMISRISSAIPFELDHGLHWRDGQVVTSLNGRDDLVRRILNTARQMVDGLVAVVVPGQVRRSHLRLSITKEVFLEHEAFKERIRKIRRWVRIQEIFERCVSRLQPPVNVDEVNREMRESFRANGMRIPDDALNVLVGRVMRRLGLRESVQQAVAKMTPASKEAIDRLESIIFMENDSGEEQCAVCTETLVTGATTTKLPCSHLFHADCAKEWLRRSHVCPLCRHELPT